MKALFGPSGNSESFYAEGHKSTLEAPKWLKERGLDLFEYSFGRGYILSSEMAEKIGKAFADEDIKMSIHAPYFINFANPDEIMYQKSIGYITTGIKFLRAFGAERLVFHPASVGKANREEAFNLAKERIISLANILEEQGLLEGIYLCPETMGKQMQIGTYEEVLQICQGNSHLVPTFDFGHINALTQGSLKTCDDYVKIFERSIELIGRERTENCHIHFSKIQYGDKGEIRHLNFDDTIYGPEFEPLAQALVKLDLHPRILSESAGHMAEDAAEMKKIYQNLLDCNEQMC